MQRLCRAHYQVASMNSDDESKFRALFDGMLSEEQIELVMANSAPIFQNLFDEIRELKERADEADKRAEEAGKQIQEALRRADNADRKFAAFDDLITIPFGLNVTRQVCSWVHDSWGEVAKGGEPYVDFLQRANHSVTFIKRCLSPNENLLIELEALRKARVMEMHGIVPVCQQILACHNRIDLVDSLRMAQPFAADIVTNAIPILFQIAATVTMQFCQAYLFDPKYHLSQNYINRCTKLLHESLQASSQNATLKSLKLDDLRRMFGHFRQSRVIKNQNIDVTREQIVSLLDLIVTSVGTSPAPGTFCPANPIADTVCSVGVELMQTCEDLGQVAPEGKIQRAVSKLTRRSTSVSEKFRKLGR